MTYLPDVNVWIALASDRHVHHPAAKAWFNGIGTMEAAFCRITELGFLRLLTNRTVMGSDVLTPIAAWRVYDELRMDPRTTFLEEHRGFQTAWRLAGDQIIGGPNARTDG